MTIAELVTTTRLLVGDPNSERWTTNDAIYNALSVAQRLFVAEVLGSPSFRDNFEVFADISASDTISVGVAGFALGGLKSTMARNGYISSRVTTGGKVRYVTRMPQSKVGMLGNQYFRGNDWTPKCYIEGDVYRLMISMGSYPKNVTLSYIAVPDKITSSTSPVISAAFHDILAIMAEEHLRRGIDEFEQAAYLRQAIIVPVIGKVASGGAKEPKSHTMGQYMRDRQNATEAQGGTR